MPRWRLSPSRLADHTELIKSPFMPLRSKSCSGDLTSTTDQRPVTVTNHTSFFVQIPSVNLIQNIYEEPTVNIQRIPRESSVNKLRKPRFAPIRSQTQDGLSTDSKTPIKKPNEAPVALYWHLFWGSKRAVQAVPGLCRGWRGNPTTPFYSTWFLDSSFAHDTTLQALSKIFATKYRSIQWVLGGKVLLLLLDVRELT
jgi:hypothetical protein